MPRFIQNSSGKAKSNRESDKHKLGVFYTPKVVAQHAIKESLSALTLNKTPEEILQLRILDPSVGDGVFLETALDFLMVYVESKVKKFDRIKWSTQIKKNCLFGVDINSSSRHIRTTIGGANFRLGCNSLLSAWCPFSTNGTPRSLSVLNCPLTGTAPNSALIKLFEERMKAFKTKNQNAIAINEIFDAWLAISIGSMNISTLKIATWSEYVEATLLHKSRPATDLSNKLSKLREKYRFFHWDLEFYGKQFDLVCGNPPWEVIETGDNVCEGFLPKESMYSAFVGKQYDLPSGRRIEMAAAFSNLAFQILDNQGALSFLLPSSINYAKTYENIRRVSFENSVNFNRFDNSSGIFVGLDKRCDFTCLNVNFGKKRRLTLSSSIYMEDGFSQADIGIKNAARIQLLSGPERLVPNFRDKVSTGVIEKVLSHCEPFDSLKANYDTWNGLNSTTDRNLIVDRKADSARYVPLASGQNINTLSTLCHDGLDIKKCVAKVDLTGRGQSQIFNKNLWEIDRIGWRKIARSDDTRTLIVAPIPKGVANQESLWSIAFEDEEFQLWCEFIWSSIPFDAVVRTIVNSNVSKFLLLGLPLPKVDASTLRMYKKLRGVFKSTAIGSSSYYNLIKNVNTLAFNFFNLSPTDQEILVRSYFNVNHPIISQITDVENIADMEAA